MKPPIPTPEPVPVQTLRRYGLHATADEVAKAYATLAHAPAPPNDGDFECEDGGKEAEEKWWADYSLFLESVRSILTTATQKKG